MRTMIRVDRSDGLGHVRVGRNATASHAQSYPARSISVVVPFPAGGPSDVVARIVTEHMGRTLGQQLVIENVGGAGGTWGAHVSPPHSRTGILCWQGVWGRMLPRQCLRRTSSMIPSVTLNRSALPRIRPRLSWREKIFRQKT